MDHLSAERAEAVAPSVQSNLVTILGRTAAYRGEPVTWKKLRALREGADIASARLWGKKVA